MSITTPLLNPRAASQSLTELVRLSFGTTGAIAIKLLGYCSLFAIPIAVILTAQGGFYTPYCLLFWVPLGLIALKSGIIGPDKDRSTPKETTTLVKVLSWSLTSVLVVGLAGIVVASAMLGFGYGKEDSDSAHIFGAIVLTAGSLTAIWLIWRIFYKTGESIGKLGRKIHQRAAN